MLYWKSLLTGEIYMMPRDFTPKFGYWELSNEKEYREYIKQRG